ncbi:hypothetical protein Sste5346_006193 [Sporothrix stenoceras]|uniref:Uncharacterized protein n=1 Tax=Sporothrix stenoceras TaxID=5173 RepID=A0ABR3Z088_9PEZI
MSEITITDSMLGDVGGKVAIVTGGASGIGEAIVTALADRGARVVIGDVNTAAGQALEASLVASKREARFFEVDVTDWPSIRAFFSSAADAFGGRIDLVFANAGIGERNTVWTDLLDEGGELAAPDFSVIDVSLRGAVYTSKLALHYFRKAPSTDAFDRGLVITGSTSSYNERPNLPLYSAAKHGVIGLMRALRHVVAADPVEKIHVGAIAPGGTETALFPSRAADAFRAQGIPVNTASSVATAAIYLATNATTNGHALTILGDRFTEVEEAITRTQEQWYGQYNTDMARRAASVRLDMLSVIRE